jgi:hypothetical protein
MPLTSITASISTGFRRMYASKNQFLLRKTKVINLIIPSISDIF